MFYKAPMTGITKYLLMSIAMTVFTVPLYLYSHSFGQRSSAPALQEQAQHPENDSNKELQAKSDTHAGSTEAEMAPSAEQSSSDSPDTGAEQANLERYSSLANLYRPPLFGKCKKLFERYNRKQIPDKPYKSFAYSFDGESAYCADAYTDKGQAAADEIVLRDCEEHQAASGKYSPCRIYTVE